MAIYPPIQFGPVRLPIGQVPKKALARVAGLTPAHAVAIRSAAAAAPPDIGPQRVQLAVYKVPRRG